MNAAELRAYGLVAQAVAQQAFDFGEDYVGHFPEEPRPIFYHMSMSIFEAVAKDLWRLKILRPLDQQQHWAYNFVFDCEVNESNAVAELNWSDGPTLAELLVTFINLFGEYGSEWGISTSPNVVFGHHSRIRPALEALALIGYLAKAEEGYVWTRLAVPIMRASYAENEWTGPIRTAKPKGPLKTL